MHAGDRKQEIYNWWPYVPHLQVFTYLYIQKTPTDVQSYNYHMHALSAFLVHFKHHFSTDHTQFKYFFLPV